MDVDPGGVLLVGGRQQATPAIVASFLCLPNGVEEVVVRVLHEGENFGRLPGLEDVCGPVVRPQTLEISDVAVFASVDDHIGDVPNVLLEGRLGRRPAEPRRVKELYRGDRDNGFDCVSRIGLDALPVPGDDHRIAASTVSDHRHVLQVELLREDRAGAHDIQVDQLPQMCANVFAPGGDGGAERGARVNAVNDEAVARKQGSQVFVAEITGDAPYA